MALVDSDQANHGGGRYVFDGSPAWPEKMAACFLGRRGGHFVGGTWGGFGDGFFRGAGCGPGSGASFSNTHTRRSPRLPKHPPAMAWRYSDEWYRHPLTQFLLRKSWNCLHRSSSQP